MSLLEELKARRNHVREQLRDIEVLQLEIDDLDIAIAALSPEGGGLGSHSQGSSESLDTTLPEAGERAEQAGADESVPAPAAQGAASHQDEHTEERTPYQEGCAAWEDGLDYDDNPYAEIDDDRRLGWATGWVKRNAQSPAPKGADRIAHWGPFASTADVARQFGASDAEAGRIERGVNAILNRGTLRVADIPSDEGKAEGDDGENVAQPKDEINGSSMVFGTTNYYIGHLDEIIDGLTPNQRSELNGFVYRDEDRGDVISQLNRKFGGYSLSYISDLGKAVRRRMNERFSGQCAASTSPDKPYSEAHEKEREDA
jgi:hypothetical protein